MSKADQILAIIQLILKGLTAVPVVGGAASLTSVLLQAFQGAVALYEAETGQPFDITQIPQQTPVK